MKKNKRFKKIFTILLIYFICLCTFNKTYAEENTDNQTEEILKSQSDSIGISSFIEEANKYKNEDFDLNIDEIITSAIKGTIDNKTIGKKILEIFFSQIGETVSTIRKCYCNCHNIKYIKKYK